MAYSIYYDVRPAILKTIKEYPELNAWFEGNPWQKDPGFNGEGVLFGWIKPRGDAAEELALFKDLEKARLAGLLVSVSANAWNSEPPLASKLRDFPELAAIATDC